MTKEYILYMRSFVPSVILKYVCLAASTILLISCATYRLEKNLEPEAKEFLYKVSYIITKQERKILLNLDPLDLEEFIQKFWEKRDPDLETEKNEFKEEYFNRIEEANRLFKEGGKRGWLQARGRIYVLLGPPEQREVYPTGRTFYDPPMEIWLYGLFPIVFIDKLKNGNFIMEPLSARNLTEITRAQKEEKLDVKPEESFFDFDLEIQHSGRNDILILIEVPYKNIWFKEEENQLKTDLQLKIEIFNSSGNRVWDDKKTYSLTLNEGKIASFIGKSYSIEIPISLDAGEYDLSVSMTNLTNNRRVRKKAKVSARITGNIGLT